MAKRRRGGSFVRGGVSGGVITKILHEKGEEAKRVAAEEVKRQAGIIADDARSRCPVRTGALRDSIAVKEYNGGLYCRISANAQNKDGIAYGQFVEFDPRINKPFMYPAFDAHVDDAKEAIMEAVRRALEG